MKETAGTIREEQGGTKKKEYYLAEPGVDTRPAAGKFRLGPGQIRAKNIWKRISLKTLL